MRVIFVILLFLMCSAESFAQIDSLKQKADTLSGNAYLIQKVDRNGVILPEVAIKAVTIYPEHHAPRKRDYRKYERLVYNLKKVYPYALIVRARLFRVNEDMKGIETDKERREYLRKVEKNVFGEYEGDIRNMTITQGRLLIKLIDRETQNTSYALIKEYRGKFSAAFWQGIARLFGTNLKEEYDPTGDDALIESIILEIDAGNL